MAKTTGFTGPQDKGTKQFRQLALNGSLVPSKLVFTISAGAANVCNVKMQVADVDGNAIAGVFNLLAMLSDASTGVGLTGTSASGTVQAKSASGTDIAALSAKKALSVNTLADGSYTLEITDTAKTTFYVAATIPGKDKLQVSRILATADYGA